MRHGQNITYIAFGTHTQKKIVKSIKSKVYFCPNKFDQTLQPVVLGLLTRNKSSAESRIVEQGGMECRHKSIGEKKKEREKSAR